MPLSDMSIQPLDWTHLFIPRRLVFIQEANGTCRELNLSHRLRSSKEANLRVGRQSGRQGTLTLGIYFDGSQDSHAERLMLSGMSEGTLVRFDICSDDRSFFGQGLLTITSGRWIPDGGELLDLSLALLVGPNGAVIQVHDLANPALRHVVALCPNCSGTGKIEAIVPTHPPTACPVCQAKAPTEPVVGSPAVAPPTKPKRRFR